MPRIILLDTGIVGHILSETDSVGNWNTLVQSIVGDTGDKYAIPTPVWYEIAQWHPGKYGEVSDQIVGGCKGIYQYANYAIPNYILMDAAWYKCQTRQKTNNPDMGGVNKNKDKISTVDALIASYCLRYGYYLLTLNSSDFPEKFFEIIKIETAPSTTDLQRDFVMLLKPRQDKWITSKKK
jgi:hypothetical protein